MSIYARNFIIDEDGKAKLIKHLNQNRVDRVSFTNPGGWNKSGKKARIMKRYNSLPTRTFDKAKAILDDLDYE